MYLFIVSLRCRSLKLFKRLGVLGFNSQILHASQLSLTGRVSTVFLWGIRVFAIQSSRVMENDKRQTAKQFHFLTVKLK